MISGEMLVSKAKKDASRSDGYQNLQKALMELDFHKAASS